MDLKFIEQMFGDTGGRFSRPWLFGYLYQEVCHYLKGEATREHLTACVAVMGLAISLYDEACTSMEPAAAALHVRKQLKTQGQGLPVPLPWERSTST